LNASACCTDADHVYVCSECEIQYPFHQFKKALDCCSEKPNPAPDEKKNAITPLNGKKTHPLTRHGLSALKQIATAPAPCTEFNPGVINRLTRGGLAEIVQLPSPYKKHSGKNAKNVNFLQITDAGRSEI
jgi:hypothetical protein